MAVLVRPDHRTEFLAMRLFSNSPGPSFEGRYPGRFWFGTAGKCMLDFVVAGFRTVHDGF